MKKVMVGLTGASCSLYGVRLVEELVNLGIETSVAFTDNGLKVAKYELQEDAHNLNSNLFQDLNVKIEDNNNIFASCSSGSNRVDALIVLPCSMGTLGAIASGLSVGLIQRVADVMLKEKGSLILCPREAPYSLIHLENMTKVAQAGGTILPCSPGFYLKPNSIDDLVNFMVGKVLDILKLDHKVCNRWNQEN